MRLVFETNREGDWTEAYILTPDNQQVYVWQGHSYPPHYFMGELIDAINRAGIQVQLNTLIVERREVNFEMRAL